MITINIRTGFFKLDNKYATTTVLMYYVMDISDVTLLREYVRVCESQREILTSNVTKSFQNKCMQQKLYDCLWNCFLKSKCIENYTRLNSHYITVIFQYVLCKSGIVVNLMF